MLITIATIFSVVIIIAGAGSLLIGLVLFVSTIRFLRIAESAVGVVVGHETKVSESPDHDGFKTAFVYPVVEFEDASERRHRVTLAIGSAGYQPFPIGSRVIVLYPPNDTARARIRSFLHLWSFPVMFTAGGIMSILGGLGLRIWTSHLA